MTEDHRCIQETAIALIQKDQDFIKESVERIEKKVDKIAEVIQNGGGLISEVTFLKRSIMRLWWLFGGIFLCFLGMIGKALF